MASGVARKRSATFTFKASDEFDSSEDEVSHTLTKEHNGTEKTHSSVSAVVQSGPKLHLRQGPSLGATIAVVFASLVLIILTIITLPRTVSHSSLSSFFHKTGPYSSGNPLGIPLHPEEHAYRHPTTIVHNWTITSGYRFPDGVKKKVYLVNGQFPGPTVECRQGDKLVIHVNNALAGSEDGINDDASDGISLLWHGLHMRGSNRMDGAVGYTQCPIPAGGSFTYEFEVGEQSGTLWWHAHSGVQRGDGMFGGLVIHKGVRGNGKVERVTDMKEYGYDKEVLLMIGDWYHQSSEEVLAWYTSARAFGNEFISDVPLIPPADLAQPVPDSLLVNGVGKFICSMAVPAKPVECIDVLDEHIPNILAGDLASTSTRLRIVNVGSLAGFTLSINESVLIPHTIDSDTRIQRRPARSVGILYPGERMDLVLELDKSSTPLAIEIILDPENFVYINYALRPNQSFPLIDSGTRSNLSHATSNHFARTESPSYFDLSESKSLLPISPKLAQDAEKLLLLYTKTQKLSINSNRPQGFMNRTSWIPQPSPLISVPRKQWDKNQLVPWISLPPTPTNKEQNQVESGKWVDIIVNNLDDGAHPFHLHGYNFYLLYSHRSEHGWGSYTPYSASSGGVPDQLELNLENPVLKDTVAVPRRGFVVLRFWANNPGIWMFHCHVLFHQASGMAMGIAVGGTEGNDDIDLRGAELCGG